MPFNLIASHELQPTKVPLALYHNTRSFCRGPHTLSKVSSGGALCLASHSHIHRPQSFLAHFRHQTPREEASDSPHLRLAWRPAPPSCMIFPLWGVSQKKSRMLMPRLQPRPSQAAQVVRLAWHQQNEDLGLRAGSHRGFITDFCGTKALPAPGARAGRY